MSTYSTEKHTCAQCGSRSDYRELTSFYAPDRQLDTRPEGISPADLVMICPVCGWAAPDVSKELSREARAGFHSPEHAAFLAALPEDAPGRALSGAAYLDGRSRLWLAAAWYWDDAGEKAAADAMRSEAAEALSAELAAKADPAGAGVLVDCLRRLSRFQEAAEGAEALIGFAERGSPEAAYAAYELKLIRDRDSGPHEMSEIPG